MDKEKLRAEWEKEENCAKIHGWDFSHIYGRFDSDGDFPWEYEQVIRERLSPEMKLLDIDTGGGEFLLSLNHPHENTSATEGYPPNVALCMDTLGKLGIDFKEAADVSALPFDDCSFDMVINRHGSFDASEINRVLKHNGIFVTQQVGAENDRELVELVLPDEKLPFPEQYSDIVTKKFTDAGFEVEMMNEAFGKICFFDTGALVWFARIIEWEFPDFSVEKCFDRLCEVQKMIEENGSVEGKTHRFIMVARKKQ